MLHSQITDSSKLCVNAQFETSTVQKLNEGWKGASHNKGHAKTTMIQEANTLLI